MSTKFLVTKTESVTDKNDQTTIHLWGRDPDQERVHARVRDFPAYFYVATEEVEGHEPSFLSSDNIKQIDHDVDMTPFQMGDVPDSLSRVVATEPDAVRRAKGVFNQTWEADVDHNNRFRIDTGTTAWVEVPSDFKPGTRTPPFSPEQVVPVEAPVDRDPEPRTLTIDIEVDDRGGFPEPGEKRVTSIVAHDSYEEEYIGFIDGDDRPIEDAFPNGKPSEVDELRVEPNEKRMLIAFACWVSERDPDILTAWNVGFDAEYLIARMDAVGANPGRLSSIKTAYNDGWDGPQIGGVSVYDLLGMYKKNSQSELRAYSLDYVAGKELGESKITHERGFWEMFEEDPTELINYNSRDTRLAVGINEQSGVIKFRDNLRKQIGVDFEDTVDNYQFIEMMARRKLRERGEAGPTANPEDAEKYEGGHVMDAYTGVARNVMGIDVESLYPWTMYMLNASPDTKIDEGRAKAEGIPYSKAPNGTCFRLDRDGLFRVLVEDALELKEGYRTLRDEAEPGSTEEAIYAVKYAVSKTVVNSLYGVIGWERFFLYDRDTAEAVTLAGQAVVKQTAEFTEAETDATVIYGDTDSNYISWPSNWTQRGCVNAANDLCERLEAELYPALAEEMNVPRDDCEWRIDPEMYAPRFLQWWKKKKYAYLAKWKEGMDPDETMQQGELVVKGGASKRSDSSRLTRDTEKKCIDAILHGRPDECNQIIYKAATSLDPDNPDWERIGIPGGIGKEFSEYDNKTAHVEAAENANTLLGTEYGKASKPMRVYLQPTYFDELGDQTDRIAYETEDDLRPIEGRLVVDATRMTETLISNPLGEMLEAVGVDIQAAIAGQNQTGLGAFV